MLNRYFIRPTTVDRIRASWIGEAIERYVVWLTEQNYAARNVSFRVPVLVRFGEFARTAGANNVGRLAGSHRAVHRRLAESSKTGIFGIPALELPPENSAIQSGNCFIWFFRITGMTRRGSPDPFVGAGPWLLRFSAP